MLVHFGAAEGGHYYSFIRERQRNGQWISFNDSNVDFFQEDQIPAECFGGYQSAQKWNSATQRNELDWSLRQNSAYMMFYHRVPRPSNCKVHSAQAKLTIPEPLPFIERVHAENRQFARDRILFHSTYSEFMLGLVGSRPEPPIELVIRFLLDTLAHQEDKGHLKATGKPLLPNVPAAVANKLLVSEPENSTWLLTELIKKTNAWRQEFFLECWDEVTRVEFGHLVRTALKTRLADNDPLTVQMVRGITELVQEAPHHPRTYPQLFHFIRVLFEESPLVRQVAPLSPSHPADDREWPAG